MRYILAGLVVLIFLGICGFSFLHIVKRRRRWRNTSVTFTGGNLSGQTAKITGFNRTERIFTVDELPSKPNSGDTFVIMNNLNGENDAEK